MAGISLQNALFRSVTAGWRFIRRVAWLVGLFGLFSAMGVVLVLRYWLLPNVENFHDQVDYALRSVIGQPVSIAHIEADWSGLRPRLLMTGVRILDQKGELALGLERVEGELAWSSLLALEPRLYSLTIDSPTLSIRRDAQGVLSVAGMPLFGAPSDGHSADWLLNQSRIEVRDAHITWQDEMRAAPLLEFKGVNLLIENGWWNGHYFALRAQPPEALASELDVRGDFSGASFTDMKGWEGQLFTQLDFADVAAWRAWVPLPVPLSSGVGAVRGWVDVTDGGVSGITADLALSDVRTRLAEDLPRLDMRTLQGRIGWHVNEKQVEFLSRKLSLKLQNGFILEPTDFTLRYAQTEGKAGLKGKVRANKLDLLGLTMLSEYLPFNRGFKRKLAAVAPRGKISGLDAEWEWLGEAESLPHFRIQADFEGMAMRQLDGLPGISGLTGRIDGNESGGSLSVNSRRLSVDAPGVMQEKLQFDTVMGQLGWEAGWSGLAVNFSNIAVENADLKGVLNGVYRTDGKGPGSLELNAHLSNAMVRRVDRYIPVSAVAKETHDWLTHGLAGGYSDDVDVRLSGDLSRFPFPGGKDGVFRIRARLHDAIIDFHKDWPRVEAIQGVLLAEGSRLEVQAESARTAGNHLGKVSAALPDMLHPDLDLQVHLESAGATAGVFDYIRKSPVLGLIGGFTRKASAVGNGELKLDLDLSILGSRPVRVGGVYRLLGADVDLGGSIPLLQKSTGELLFSESSVNTRNFNTRILGGPATLEVKSSDGAKVISVRASGTSDMDALRTVSSLPVLRYLHGGSPWSLSVTSQKGQSVIRFNTDLAGTASDLPAPFAKKAEDKFQLSFDEKFPAGGDLAEISVQGGDWLSARLLQKRNGNGNWQTRRGLVVFGKPQKWPERDGLWVRGELPWLSLEGWGPMLSMLGGDTQDDDAGIAGMDLHIDKVSGFQLSEENMHITAASAQGRLVAHLASRDFNGDLTWEPQDRGTLNIHLSSLAMGKGAQKDDKTESGADKNETGAGKPVAAVIQPPPGRGESPDIHLRVDNLLYHLKQLGSLEMQARQHEGNWELQHVVLKNPYGEMRANGKWLATSLVPSTALSFDLKVSDAGKLLAQLGYPGTVEKGRGGLALAGGKDNVALRADNLSWSGGPGDFDPAKLDGMLYMVVEDGAFLKIDPKTSGLLRILSLQAFNLAGVLSDGVHFDKLNGKARINQGVMKIEDFQLEGAGLKIAMDGEVNLSKETQDLKIIVQPAVSGGVTILVALFTNPLLALEIWLMNKFAKNPLEKAASVTFLVKGTWDKPDVSKGEVKKGAPETTGK